MLPESLHVDWKAATRWERAAVLVWLIALAIVCTRSALTPHRQNVLHIFTLAGQHWQHGEPMYGSVTPDRDVFRYSPLAAATFVPLSRVPLAWANVAWRLFNAAALVLGLAWFVRAVVPVTLTRTEQGLLYLLLLPLALPSLNNGQINPLLVGLLLSAVAACREQRWWLASLLLSGAVWLKLYPIALALLLALLHPRQLSGRLGLALLAGLLAPFLLQEPSYVLAQYRQWLEYLAADNREVLPLRYWLRDIRLLFRVWLVPLSPAVFAAMQMAVAAGMAGLCWMSARRGWPRAEQLLLVLQLACCWMTLFGPSTESATWIVLAPALLLSLLLVRRSADSPWLPVLLASYVLLVSAHMARWFPWGSVYANLAPQALAGLLYFAVLVATAVRRLRFANAVREEQASLPAKCRGLIGNTTPSRSW